MTNTNLEPPKVSPLWLVLALATFLLILFTLSGCSAEKMALKPYKKVAADSDLPRSQAKRNILAGILAAEFPILEITKEKDSVVTLHKKDSLAIANQIRSIKALNDRIAALNISKPKGCPPCPYIDVDSILNDCPTDTIYVDRWHSKETTKHDTISNWLKANELEAYKLTAAQLQFNLTNKTNEFNDLKAYTKTWSYLGNEAWDKLKWWLLGLVILYVGYRILKSKFTLPF